MQNFALLDVGRGGRGWFILDDRGDSLRGLLVLQGGAVPIKLLNCDVIFQRHQLWLNSLAGRRC